MKSGQPQRLEAETRTEQQEPGEIASDGRHQGEIGLESSAFVGHGVVCVDE
jgi:hypothetical protein